jgi:transposase
MWTETAREQYRREDLRYASDMTEWALISPHLPGQKALGRPRIVPLRGVVDALLYILRTACPWRLLPRDFPKRSTTPGVPPPGFSILRKSAVCGPRRGGQRSGAAARRSRASPRFPGLSRQYACRQDRFVPYRVDDLRHASDPTRRNGMARCSPPIVQ